MGFWLIVFHWLSELYLGLSSKDALYHIWWSVSLREREKNKHSCAVSSMLLYFRFPLLTSAGAPQSPLFCFIWLWSEVDCEHEHEAPANARATSDLIPTRTVQAWWSPPFQTCWPSVDKLAGCWGASVCSLQPEVICLLLNGCCWAASLQLLFPCLTSQTSPFSLSLNGNKIEPRGALLDNFCSPVWRLCQVSAPVDGLDYSRLTGRRNSAQQKHWLDNSENCRFLSVHVLASNRK